MGVDLIQLREALEASWDDKTSYRGVLESGNPALGQCYPTSRIVQLYIPEAEIVEGQVWTGKSIEKHFWNLIQLKDTTYHIDLAWQQFPSGSIVKSWKVRNRETLGDSQPTIDRVTLLYQRVQKYLVKLKLK